VRLLKYAFIKFSFEQMTYSAIHKSITAGNFKPVYLLHGEESYFIDLLTNLILQKALQPHEHDFNLSILYGKEVNAKQVIAAAKQFPMMSQRRVVILKEAQQMRDFKNLDAYLPQPVASTILVINYKNKKADGKIRLVKGIKKLEGAFLSDKLKEWEVPKWITQYLTKKGFQLKDGIANLVSDYLGNDLSKITNELDKLLLNLQEGASIDKKTVEKYIGIHRDYNLFALQNALGEKNAGQSFKIAKYFSTNPNKNPMVLVLGNLFSFFNKLYVYHHVKNLDRQTQMKALRTFNDFAYNQTSKAAAKYSPQKLQVIFQLIREADLKSKGIGMTSKNDDALYKELIFKILN